MRYICADESGVRVDIEADTAREAAEEYVADGDWAESLETWWCSVWTREDDEDAITSHHLIAVEPAEPECVDRHADHEWASDHEVVGGIADNPGVWGHGGGVTITEYCRRCGCGRTVDTWAQDRGTGIQGLRGISYQPGQFAALEAA